MSGPNKFQLQLIDSCKDNIKDNEINKYFDLQNQYREAISTRDSKIQEDFCRRFWSYYKLNHAFVGPKFKEKYFHFLLRNDYPKVPDPYTYLLSTLYQYPRDKGDHVLQCSFVSKLVAFHDESYPLYDNFISRFFGVCIPSSGSKDFRIAGFVENILWIRKTYKDWLQDKGIIQIIQEVKKKHPRLSECSDMRILDFLIWNTGDVKKGAKK